MSTPPELTQDATPNQTIGMIRRDYNLRKAAAAASEPTARRRLDMGTTSWFESIMSLILTTVSWMSSLFRLPDAEVFTIWVLPTVIVGYFIWLSKPTVLVATFTFLLGSMQDIFGFVTRMLSVFVTIRFDDILSFLVSRIDNCMESIDLIKQICYSVLTWMITSVIDKCVYLWFPIVLICSVFLGRYIWTNIRMNIIGGCVITVLMITVVLQSTLFVMICQTTPTMTNTVSPYVY